MEIINCPHCNGLINVTQKILVVSTVGEVLYKAIKSKRVPVIDHKIKPLTDEQKETIRQHNAQGWKNITKKKLAAKLGIRNMQIAGILAGLAREKKAKRK